MSDQLKKIMIGCCAGFVILFIILAILVGCQNSSKSYGNSFMDENRLVSRMVNELKLYNKNDKMTSEEIVKLYDNYTDDIRKYFRKYENYNKNLKKELKYFIDKKQDKYEKEMKTINGKAKELVLQNFI